MKYNRTQYVLMLALFFVMLKGCSREADPRKAEASLEGMLHKAVSRDRGGETRFFWA